jgi:hypothetical protein
VFYPDVAYIAVAIHIRCKRILQMFYPFQTYVVEVLDVATLTGVGRDACRGGPHVRGKQSGREWSLPACTSVDTGAQLYTHQHAVAGV